MPDQAAWAQGTTQPTDEESEPSFDEQLREEQKELLSEMRATENKVFALLSKVEEAKAKLDEARNLEAAIAAECLEAMREGRSDAQLADRWKQSQEALQAAIEEFVSLVAEADDARAHHAFLAERLAFTAREIRELFPMAAADPPESSPPGAFPSVIEIHYGTDRSLGERKGFIQEYGIKSDGLCFGVCHVSIPKDHKPGCIEEPRWWQSESIEKHVVLMDAFAMPEEGFFGSLAGAISRSAAKEALVFVHGYNTSFEDAAKRTAQLTYDLGFEGAPMMYAWPSRANEDDYLTDREMATDFSCRHFAAFLKLLHEKSGATRIHIIAHSMGNEVLCRALEQINREAGELPSPKFGHIVMAAPDVWATAFREIFAVPMSKRAEHVTVYASSIDLALTLSQWLRSGEPRLGATDRQLTLVDGIDMVVANEFDKGLLNHAYFGDSVSILQDLIALIRLGLAPDQRCLATMTSENQKRYWECRRQIGEDCRSHLLRAIADQ